MNVSRQVESIGSRLAGIRHARGLAGVLDITKTAGRTLATSDGRASARTLTYYRNRFKGERAIIIGNGPSLRSTDLSLLQGEYTFGLNRVYLLFDELRFQTTFLVAVNQLLISQVAKDLSKVQSQKFFGWSSRGLFSATNDQTFVQSRRQPGFVEDVRLGVWEGATVTYVAMQLAFHMGFSEIVLVGVDHRFVTTGPAHEVVVSSGPDQNHFHPNYFGSGFRWQLPDLETSEYAYQLALDSYNRAGRRVVDATVGGNLNVFPKVDLAEALA